MTEQWKWVEGYEELYQVSNYGKVRRVGKKVTLKPDKNKQGYLTVRFSRFNKGKRERIARLVAKAFIPNPESKPQVNHIDGNKLNNLYTNLGWATPKENIWHAIKLGISSCKSGVNHWGAKLNEKSVKQIKNLYKTGNYSQRQLGKKFGVCQRNIFDVLKNNIWRNCDHQP